MAAVLIVATRIACAGEIPRDQRRSGYDQMTPATQALQDDDMANPGLLWLLDGEAQWKEKAGRKVQSCSGCHGDASDSMKGVAARYPAYHPESGAMNIEGRINLCRTKHMDAPGFALESKELLALTMFVAAQSKGLPIAIDERKLMPQVEQGRRIYDSRQGQLNLSCAQCHDDNWGKTLAGSTIPQGHPTGYPQYRLEWQSVGSLHRRLRNCLTGMRAENYMSGSPELIALEAYLMSRAQGMPIENPAVRP